MKILFIYSALPKGGIETFFVRMSKKLVENNYKITFLFLTRYADKDLLNDLLSFSEVFYLDDFINFKFQISKKTPLLKLLLPFKREIYNKVLKDVSHIHAPDFNALLFTNKLLSGYKKIPISTGLYHINEFNFDENKDWYFSKKIERYMKNIPSQNVLFFNEISNDFYNNKYQNKFRDSIITPIGVDLDNSENILGKQNSSIVSIGRLTSWKTYNYHMIEAIKNLKKKNIIVYYNSYGDGEEKEQLEEEVILNGLQDQIKFNAGIPYKDFKKTVSGHLMFIGAGTALIEASSFGIPGLIGIENGKEAQSYGFLHQTNGLSYQEKQLNLPKASVESYIEFLLFLDKDKYNNECVNAKKRAKDFGIEKTTKDFIKLIKTSKTQTYYFSSLEIRKMVLSMFFNKVVNPKKNYSKRL